MSVYGSETSKEGLIGLTNEDQKCNPKSFYAVGKLASEMYLKIYSSFELNVQHSGCLMYMEKDKT